MNADEFCRTLQLRYAVVGDIRTHYVKCGSGPTLVLMHGLSASIWNWWRNLEALSRQFHVIAYDLAVDNPPSRGVRAAEPPLAISRRHIPGTR